MCWDMVRYLVKRAKQSFNPLSAESQFDFLRCTLCEAHGAFDNEGSELKSRSGATVTERLGLRHYCERPLDLRSRCEPRAPEEQDASRCCCYGSAERTGRRIAT